MANVTALKKARKTDERAELRAAIEAETAAKRKLQGRENALHLAGKHLNDAQEKLAVVTNAIERAKESVAKRTASALSSGRAPPDSTVLEDARAAVARANDVVDAAQSAVAQLREEIAVLAAEVHQHEAAVIAAAHDVVCAPMREVLAQTKRLHAEAFIARQTLAAVWEATAAHGVKAGTIADVRAATSHLLRAETLPIDEATRDAAKDASAQWRAALVALREDADAALPFPGGG